MTSNVCLFCKRMMSDHTKDEHYECALKLCNGKLAVDACGADGQLIQKPARSYPKEVSS